MQLRYVIERFETHNSSIFEKRVTELNGTFKEHLQKLYHPNTRATHIEVFAIATYFQAPVYFCTDHPHQQRGCYCWECFKPVDSAENLSYPYVIEPPFDYKVSVHHFEIVYHIGYHYNSIVSCETEKLCLSPPSLTEETIYVDEIIQ